MCSTEKAYPPYSVGRAEHIRVVDLPSAVELTIKPFRAHIWRETASVALGAAGIGILAAIVSAHWGMNSDGGGWMVVGIGLLLGRRRLRRMILTFIPLHFYAGELGLVMYRHGPVRGSRVALPQNMVSDLKMIETGKSRYYEARIILSVTDGREISLGEGPMEEVATIVHHLRRGLALVTPPAKG
jgi:hypothetical protein